MQIFNYDSIKVNTAAVVQAAGRIAQHNADIRDDFEEVENAVKSMNQVWDGSAANKAASIFWELKENYKEPRYQVVNVLTNFMLQAVGESYEQTETALVSAASAFK